MVHLGATLGASICRRFQLPDASRRVLLACGVASAVSASFNAPIAGMIFAHEVVLGHYALSAIVPVVLASVIGTLLTRLWFGDVAAFIIPDHQITSYWEFPAFALLGVTCAAVAILFQFSLIATDWVARHITMPTWLRPAVGGVMIGDIPSFRVDHLPYGGVKDSGFGREGLRFAIEDMTEIRLLAIRGE